MSFRISPFDVRITPRTLRSGPGTQRVRYRKRDTTRGNARTEQCQWMTTAESLRKSQSDQRNDGELQKLPSCCLQRNEAPRDDSGNRDTDNI